MEMSEEGRRFEGRTGLVWGMESGAGRGSEGGAIVTFEICFDVEIGSWRRWIDCGKWRMGEGSGLNGIYGMMAGLCTLRRDGHMMILLSFERAASSVAGAMVSLQRKEHEYLYGRRGW